MKKPGKLKTIVRVPQPPSQVLVGDSDKLSEGEGIPFAIFNSHENPFLMTESCCNNPECDCNEIHLDFTEVDKDSKYPVSNPITFSLSLDLGTWQEKRIRQRPEVSQRLVDEFINDLTEDAKSRFKWIYDFTKERARNAARFKISRNEIDDGVLVSYSEVFGNTGSVLSGGKGVGFTFEHKGRGEKYFIEDLYCINPQCDCESVKFVFLRYDKKKKVCSDIFACNFSFKFGLKIDSSYGCTKKEARKIFKSWKNSEPELVGIWKNRYEEMREIGERLVSENNRSRGTGDVNM